MLRVAGVPFFRRWIMWAAVAMRSRWAAGGLRRMSLLLWAALAAIGITVFVAGAGAAFGGGRLFGARPAVSLLIAVVLPFASAPLWGRQYGAGIVAAAAAIWIFPPAVIAAAGYGIYLGLEWLADRAVR